jgi:hypothetical protein
MPRPQLAEAFHIETRVLASIREAFTDLLCGQLHFLRQIDVVAKTFRRSEWRCAVARVNLSNITIARLIIGSASPNLFVACNSLARLLRSVATSGCSGYNFSHLRPAPGASTARPPPAGS